MPKKPSVRCFQRAQRRSVADQAGCPPQHTARGPGAGTALYPNKTPSALAVRFDAMRDIRLPEQPGEEWVEVEAGLPGWDSREAA